MGVPQGTADQVGTDARGQQPGGQLVHRRCRRGETERSRVGHQTGVDRCRDVPVEPHAQGIDEVDDHGAGRGCLGVDQVEIAEPGVGGMVVDDQDPATGRGAGEPAQPGPAAGVQGHHETRPAGDGLGSHQQILTGEEAKHPGNDEGIGVEGYPRPSAQRPQREPQRQRRSETVPVGVHVGDQQDAVTGVDRAGQCGHRGLEITGRTGTARAGAADRRRRRVHEIGRIAHRQFPSPLSRPIAAVSCLSPRCPGPVPVIPPAGPSRRTRPPHPARPAHRAHPARRWRSAAGGRDRRRPPGEHPDGPRPDTRRVPGQR